MSKKKYKNLARERFTERQVLAMTELAERVEWSISSIPFEDRIKFCEDNNITKVI